MEFNSGFKTLPLTGDSFYINEEGTVKDSFGNIVDSCFNVEGKKVVSLYWYKGYQSYEVAFLLLTVFKPFTVPYFSWDKMRVEYRNNDVNDLRLENIGWKYPEKGLESHRFPGFFYIPGFSRYLINKEACVIRTFDGRALQGSKTKNGYISITLRPDVVKGRWPTLGRHRLLALTFIDNGFCIEDLEVNHINGIPGSDTIENLEWCSRSKNLLHAFSIGKRLDNKKVVTTNICTGERVEYFSAYECERQLGLKRGVVYYRIKFGKDKSFSGLKFEYLDKSKTVKKDPISLKLTDLKTNKTTIFSSMKKCSDAINVSKKVIQKRIKKDNVAFFRHYRFEKI